MRSKWHGIGLLRAVAIAGAVVMALASQLFAQSPSSNREEYGNLAGRVYGPGGRALAGARVLLVEARRSATFNTVTDESGGFDFKGLPAGLYEVTASKEAFASPRPGGESDERSSMVRIEANSDVRGVDLKLQRGGVITGRITDESGEPVVLGTVTVIDLEGKNDARYGLRPESATTDDRGVYRLFGLSGGRYVVQANYRQTTGQQEQHVTDYYPSVGLQSEAQPVEVAAGGEVTGIDLTLRRAGGSRGSISGRITRADGKPLLQVAVWTYTAGPSATRVTTVPKQDGSYEVKGLPAGTYTVEVLSKDPMLVERTRKGAVVNGESEAEVNIAVQPGAEIAGWFEQENGSRPKRLAGLSVAVKAEDVHYQNSVAVQQDGSFRLTRLPSGSLQLSAYTMGSPYYVDRILLDATQIEEGRLSLDAGARVHGIRVILSDQGSIVRGIVQDAGGTARVAGAWVLVVPSDAPRQEFETRARSGRVDQRGQFIIEGIMPGRYFVIATRNPQSLPTEPDGLAQWVAQRQLLVATVDLKAKSQQQLQLRLITE